MSRRRPSVFALCRVGQRRRYAQALPATQLVPLYLRNQPDLQRIIPAVSIFMGAFNLVALWGTYDVFLGPFSLATQQAPDIAWVLTIIKPTCAVTNLLGAAMAWFWRFNCHSLAYSVEFDPSAAQLQIRTHTLMGKPSHSPVAATYADFDVGSRRLHSQPDTWLSTQPRLLFKHQALLLHKDFFVPGSNGRALFDALSRSDRAECRRLVKDPKW